MDFDNSLGCQKYACLNIFYNQPIVAVQELLGCFDFCSHMISHDSPLKKLSARSDRKQALFIDGIRHAAEIASLAYLRLRETLTQIALTDIPENDISKYSTAAYLDAWAFVDATDRFRTLWKQMPSVGKAQPAPGVLPLEEALQPIRYLRNVADHIAQRIDLVMSKNSATLGIVSWVTATSPNPAKCLMCAIIPGTLRAQKVEFLRQELRSFELPTGNIWLEAGGYKACLCDAVPHMALRVESLEQLVAATNADLPEDEPYAASDAVLKLLVEFEGYKVTQVRLGDMAINQSLKPTSSGNP